MDAALAAVERGVRALFTDQSALLLASTRSPLCECTLQQSPTSDWRHLRRFPVLKRQVLGGFRVVALEMGKMPQTPRKRKKRSPLQQRNDTTEYRAACLASLCQNLAQCELLTLFEAELLQNVVNLEPLDVLGRVIGGKLLPLRLRMLLLGFTLQSQEEKILEMSVQKWIQEVCEKILEETLEATSGAVGPPQKRARTRSGDKETTNPQEVEKCCNFCRDGASFESLRSNFGGWEFLVKCTHRSAQLMEKAGESYADNSAMIALSAFWDSLPVAGVPAVKVGWRRKRAEIAGNCEEEVESLSVSAYERVCQLVIESLPDLQNLGEKSIGAAKKMWANVWRRESKNAAEMKQITLVDAIRHCSKADAFVGILTPRHRNGNVLQLLGYRVVTEVIRSLFVSTSGIITAFAQVWSGLSSERNGAFFRITVSNNAGTLSTKRVLRSYLSELLRCPNFRNELQSSGTQKPPVSSRVTTLELLFVLYEVFSEPVPRIQQSSSYPKYWDILLTHVCGVGSTKRCAQEGINWCKMLENCVHSLSDNTLGAICHHEFFLNAFKSYCLSTMSGVLETSGEIITSGGTIQWRLISVENDRAIVRRVLTLMMTTFGEEWVSQLIAHLMRANTSLRSTHEVNLRGIKNLLCPALVSCMKANNHFDQKRQKAGQEQFIEYVQAVNSFLKDREITSLYLVSLVRFCEAWDAYQSTHTKEPPTRANRWGFRAMIELNVLPELLECYGSNAIVREETSDVLVFAGEVLQNALTCPPTLEENLYKVLSALKEGAEQAKTSILGLPEVDKQLVSHSNDILQRLLRAVKFADVTQTRQLMDQMKDAAGSLNELREQLERWFSFVEMHGTAFVGKESRLDLSLLCTRLIRWFPDEFESMHYLFMTPLDSHLVFALKAFVKEAGRSNNVGEQKSVVSSALSLSLPSAVRVEMALHLYLSAAAFPDLETLTVLLTKALVKCRSPDAYDHLMKVAQKNTRVLLAEAAVATLRSPLQGLEFSSSSPAYQDDEDDDDTQLQHYARRAKSIIYQENALKLLAVARSVFEGGISWSTELFDEQSAVIWLPHFFEYVLKSDFCDGTLRADLLLGTLENLMLAEADVGDKALPGGYWLAALLNTALIACSSRSAGAFADLEAKIHDRLQIVTRKVLRCLWISPSKATPQITDADVDSTAQLDGLLGLLNMSKFSWMIIQGKCASWSHERFISEQAASALRVSMSGAWAATEEQKQNVVEPAIQLFLPFTHWLSGALVYSQSFLGEASATMRRWELTFGSYVTDLFLRLQFEDDSCSLLETWLSTWINSNIIRGQEEMQLLALLPSQVALFRRLAIRPYRDSTSIWKLVFVAINIAVDHTTPENPSEIEQATELVVSTLTTLELVDLSASVDFADFGHVQEMEPFFENLDKLLSRPQLRMCNAAQVCCLLQPPLELIVCCYACKISADFEAESQQFLQRVKTLLQENVSTINTDADDQISDKPLALDSTEVATFLLYWADEMLLKYDYLDRERCSTVLEVIQTGFADDNDNNWR